jgi:hypothetical protein
MAQTGAPRPIGRFHCARTTQSNLSHETYAKICRGPPGFCLPRLITQSGPALGSLSMCQSEANDLSAADALDAACPFAKIFIKLIMVEFNP